MCSGTDVATRSCVKINQVVASMAWRRRKFDFHTGYRAQVKMQAQKEKEKKLYAGKKLFDGKDRPAEEGASCGVLLRRAGGPTRCPPPPPEAEAPPPAAQ